MKVLITGAGGHIGKRVVAEFAAHGYDIRAVDIQPMGKDLLSDFDAEIVYADLADPLQALRAAQGCEGVVHLAAIPNPIHQRSVLMDTNVKATYNVLDAAYAAGIERVIVTSSVGAIGYSYPIRPLHPQYLPVDIDHPCTPTDVYGLSKQLNELTAQMFTRRHGMTTIAIRPPYVADLHHVAKRGWLARMLDRGKREFENALWGYIHTDDLARAFRLAWEAPLDSASYNVFFTMMDDVLSEETPQTLIERFLPELAGYANRVDKCLYDLSLTKAKLGFTAELTWREALAQAER